MTRRRHIAWDPERGAMRGDHPITGIAACTSLSAGLMGVADGLPRVIEAAQARPRASDLTHIHDNLAEIRLILTGSGTIRIAGHEYAYGSNDVLIIEAGDEHQTLSVARGTTALHLHVWISAATAGDRPSQMGFLSARISQHRHLRLGSGHPASAALHRAYQAHREGALGSDLIAGLGVAEALILLARERGTPTPPNLDRGELLVAAVREHIAHNFAREPAIDALLRPYRLHPNYLRGIFKAKTGLSIRDAWLQERIRAAQALLRHSDLPITSIAARVGFQEYQAFVRRFRSQCGMTPTQWRSTQR